MEKLLFQFEHNNRLNAYITIMIASFRFWTLTCCALALLVTQPTSTLALIPVSSKVFSTRSGLGVVRDIERPPTFLDERNNDDEDLNVLFVNDDDDDDEYEERTSQTAKKEKGAGRKRWEALNPKIKQRLIADGQARAIANKKKREPASDKKRSESNHNVMGLVCGDPTGFLTNNALFYVFPTTLQG